MISEREAENIVSEYDKTELGVSYNYNIMTRIYNGRVEKYINGVLIKDVEPEYESVRRECEPMGRFRFDDKNRVLDVFQSDKLEAEFDLTIRTVVSDVHVVFASGKEDEYSNATPIKVYKTSYEDPVTTVTFTNRFFPTCIKKYTVKCHKADAAAIDERNKKKMDEENQAKMLKNFDVHCAADDRFINIYFNKSCSDACKTKAFLYKGNRFLGTFVPQDGMMFISIGGLVKGDYSIEVAQYDNDDRELVRSGKKTVGIKEPITDYTPA